MKTFSICSLALVTSLITANTVNVKPASAEPIYVYFGAVVQESDVVQESCVAQRALSDSEASLNLANDSSLCAVTQEMIRADQAANANQQLLESTLSQPEAPYLQVTTVIQ